MQKKITFFRDTMLQGKQYEGGDAFESSAGDPITGLGTGCWGGE